MVAMVIPLTRRRKELPDFQKSTASTRRSGTPKSPKLRRRQHWRFVPGAANSDVHRILQWKLK
jgi:hypothetical protein